MQNLFENVNTVRVEEANWSGRLPCAFSQSLEIQTTYFPREKISQSIRQANSHHPTIKFTAEVSATETTFLDTTIYKGDRFLKDSVLDVRTHFKPTETFQYTHFTSSHPPGVKKGFIKEEALRLLRTNSSKKIIEEKIKVFKSHLLERNYPEKVIQTTLLEVKFEGRKLALYPKQKQKENKRTDYLKRSFFVQRSSVVEQLTCRPKTSVFTHRFQI